MSRETAETPSYQGVRGGGVTDFVGSGFGSGSKPCLDIELESAESYQAQSNYNII